jgi:hypothetical protein
MVISMKWMFHCQHVAYSSVVPVAVADTTTVELWCSVAVVHPGFVGGLSIHSSAVGWFGRRQVVSTYSHFD